MVLYYLVSLPEMRAENWTKAVGFAPECNNAQLTARDNVHVQYCVLVLYFCIYIHIYTDMRTFFIGVAKWRPFSSVIIVSKSVLILFVRHETDCPNHGDICGNRACSMCSVTGCYFYRVLLLQSKKPSCWF